MGMPFDAEGFGVRRWSKSRTGFWRDNSYLASCNFAYFRALVSRSAGGELKTVMVRVGAAMA